MSENIIEYECGCKEYVEEDRAKAVCDQHHCRIASNIFKLMMKTANENSIELDRLRRQLERNRDSILELQSILHAKQLEVASLTKDRDNWRTTAGNHQKEYERLDNRCRAYVEEIEALKETIIELSTQLRTAEEAHRNCKETEPHLIPNNIPEPEYKIDFSKALPLKEGKYQFFVGMDVAKPSMQPGMVTLKKEEWEYKVQRLALLESAIRTHRDLQQHDRCWTDDMKLYNALGEPFPPQMGQLPDPKQFLTECVNYCFHRASSYAAPEDSRPAGIYRKFQIGDKIRSAKLDPKLTDVKPLTVIGYVIEQMGEQQMSIRYRVEDRAANGIAWFYMREEDLERIR